MEHQDWKTVYMRPKSNPHTKKEKDNKKATITKTQTSHKERKLNELIEGGNMKTKIFQADFRRSVQTYRLSKQLSQKELAQKVRVPEGTIRDLENGKLPYNGSLMAKLKKIMR